MEKSAFAASSDKLGKERRIIEVLPAVIPVPAPATVPAPAPMEPVKARVSWADEPTAVYA